MLPNVDYSVVKNTLTRFAANKAGYTEFDELLNGTTSMASTTGRPHRSGSRSSANLPRRTRTSVKIKGGMVEGSRSVALTSCMSFGELPSKNALVAQVLGTLPRSYFSASAVVLNQILEQKGGAPRRGCGSRSLIHHLT